MTLAVRRERPVGRALHEELLGPEAEELAFHPWPRADGCLADGESAVDLAGGATATKSALAQIERRRPAQACAVHGQGNPRPREPPRLCSREAPPTSLGSPRPRSPCSIRRSDTEISLSNHLIGAEVHFECQSRHLRNQRVCVRDRTREASPSTRLAPGQPKNVTALVAQGPRWAEPRSAIIAGPVVSLD